MSSSELRYLITANELAEQTENVKQTDVANKLRVSKVSTYNAMERLRDKGFIEKNERKIVLTDRGKEVLNEYIFERVYDDYTLYVGAFVAALRND